MSTLPIFVVGPSLWPLLAFSPTGHWEGGIARYISDAELVDGCLWPCLWPVPHIARRAAASCCRLCACVPRKPRYICHVCKHLPQKSFASLCVCEHRMLHALRMSKMSGSKLYTQSLRVTHVTPHTPHTFQGPSCAPTSRGMVVLQRLLPHPRQ